MIDEAFLEDLIEKSFHQEELKSLLYVDKEEGYFGHFKGLDEPCSVSFSLKNDDLPISPNAPAEQLELDDTVVKHVMQVLNDNGFPAVTEDNAEDASKILVTKTGIQLPYMKAEDSLQMMADVLDVLRENDVHVRGFAHPMSKDGITRCAVGENNFGGRVSEDNPECKNISDNYNMSTEAFISKKLAEIESSGLSKGDMITQAQSKDSLWRGATLGSQGHALLSKLECKNFGYASPDFNSAQEYANEHGRGFDAPNGERYGFVYEYEVSEDNRYFNDYQAENGQKGFKEKSYETMIEPHQNKLKGIYVKAGDKFMKIADENGYISKEWESFAKVHDPINRLENPKMVERGNAMFEAAQKGEVLNSYKRRESNYSSVTQDEVMNRIQGNMVKNTVMLSGEVNNADLVDMPGHFLLKDATLKDVDLHYCEKVTFQGKLNADENSRLPEYFNVRNAEISENVDLSAVSVMTMNGNISIGNAKKMPADIRGDSVTLYDSNIPENTNLGNVKYLELQDKVNVAETVTLPNQLKIKDADVNGIDLSSVQNLTLQGDVKFGKGVTLPDHVSAGELKSISVHEEDLEQMQKMQSLDLCPIIVLDKEGKEKAVIADKSNPAHSFALTRLGLDKADTYKSIHDFANPKDDYDKFIEKDADKTLRNIYQEYWKKDPAGCKKMVDEWTAEFKKNPTQKDAVAQGIMAKYKKELQPFVEPMIKAQNQLQQPAQQQSQETAKQPEKTAQQAQPMAQTATMQQPVQQSQPMMQQPMQQTQQDNKPQVFQYTPYTMPHIIQEQPQPQPQPQVQQPTMETVQPQIQQPTISNEQSAQYDQFVATNADAKLRAACSDMMNREPEKYTKIVSDWTAQYNADPLHPENAVNNVLATYKQDLMPYVEPAMKSEQYDKFMENDSYKKLYSACMDMKENDPTTYAKVVGDWQAQYDVLKAQPNSNPAQYDAMVKGLAAKYKQDLMPYVEPAMKGQQTQTQIKSLQGQTYTAMTNNDKAAFVKALRQGDNLISGEGFKAATARAPTNPQQTNTYAGKQTLAFAQMQQKSSGGRV